MESFSINNTESFRQLYSRYYKALMLYAMKMTEDEETAEDIVQNVFLHLWENREIFDDENVVRNFLYLSVRRRAIDHARHVKVEGVCLGKRRGDRGCMGGQRGLQERDIPPTHGSHQRVATPTARDFPALYARQEKHRDSPDDEHIRGDHPSAKETSTQDTQEKSGRQIYHFSSFLVNVCHPLSY